MKNNSLDEIINCKISIETPASSDISFDMIMVIASTPTTKTTEPTTSYSEVTPDTGDNPSSNGWYEENDGEYTLSEDTVCDTTKTYYTVSQDYDYSAVTNADAGDNPSDSEWYEYDENQKAYYPSPDTHINTDVTYYQLDADVVTPEGTENPSEEGWFVQDGPDYYLSEDTTVDSDKTYYTVVAVSIEEYSTGDNPSNMGWFVKSGDTYVQSTDTYVHDDTTYYTRSLVNVYTEVENINYGDDPVEKGWYELVSGSYVLSTDRLWDAEKTYFEAVVTPAGQDVDADVAGTFVTVQKANDLVDYGFETSSDAYKAVNVAFAQNPCPSEIMVYAKPTEETYVSAVSSAYALTNFYGVYLVGTTNADDYEAVAEWVENNEKMFIYEYTTYGSNPITTNDYYRTAGIFSGLAVDYTENNQPENNKYAGLAWMSKCFGYQPGSESWHLKELAKIIPSGITTVQKNALKAENVTRILRYAGKNVTVGGTLNSGEWIDVIRFRDWLKNEIQMNCIKAFYKNTKIGYTDDGIAIIEGAIKEALDLGQTNGGIVEDSFDDDNNPVYGYSVTVPDVDDMDESQRYSRVLTGIYWTARLTGAIHFVTINGTLTF